MAGEGAGMVICLHGDLEFEIIEVQCLPNMDLVSERLRRFLTAFDCRRPFITNRRRDRYHHRNIITSDPYVTVCLGGAVVARTRVLANSQYPVWDEHFKIPLAHPVSQVEFQVKDNDVFGAYLIGVASVSAERIASGELVDEWFQIVGPCTKHDCSIRVRLKFTPFHQNPLYQATYGLRESYFPLRHGGEG